MSIKLKAILKTLLRTIISIASIIIIIWAVLVWKHHVAVMQSNRFVTATVDRANIKQFVTTSGTLNPVKLVNIGTQISGLVKALNVDYNDVVEPGQVLAELDQSLLNAQLAQSEGSLANAQALLTQAEADFKRQEALFKQGFIASSDYDKAIETKASAEAQVQSAKGQVEFIKTELGYTVIRSPVAGIVISRQIDVGQTVAASYQTPTLFVIAQDLKKMEIDSSLSEADVGSVRERMPVVFTVDAFPGRKYTGVVRQIRLNPTNVQNVVTYNVVIDVENPDLTLLPGMTTFATILEDEHKDVLRVPRGALSFRLMGQKPDSVVRDGIDSQPKEAGEPVAEKNGSTPTGSAGEGAHTSVPKQEEHGVYVLKDGKIIRTIIKTGISDSKYTEVLSGPLREGDLVITDDTQPVAKTNSKPGTIAGAKPL